jgi:hypothetical protein
MSAATATRPTTAAPPTTTDRRRRPVSTVLPVVHLHLSRRAAMFAVPLYILAAVIVITVIITIAISTAAAGEGVPENARYNQAMVWSMPGYLVYLGVASVAGTYPLGLAFGATRRAYALGTLLSHAVIAVYVTVVATLGLLIELATGHFGGGFYLFDVHLLGSGDLARFVPIVFLGVLGSLTIGSVFGAAWVRFGTNGPTVLALGLVLLLVGFGWLALQNLDTIVSAFELWWLAVGAVAVIAASCLGVFAFLRKASVR